jgi:hypothetical protein
MNKKGTNGYLIYLAGNLSLQNSFVINAHFCIDSPEVPRFPDRCLMLPTSVHHSLQLSTDVLTSCMCCHFLLERADKAIVNAGMHMLSVAKGLHIWTLWMLSSVYLAVIVFLPVYL